MKLLLIGLCVAALFVNTAAADPLLQTKVSDGAVQGIRQGSVAAYLGVPFASPPVGENRWRAPQPLVAWAGTRDANHFASSCYQEVSDQGFGPWTSEYVVHGAVSEDCLYLNVWTPASTAKVHLPVLVWIHGGGFSAGSGSVPIYDGAALAAEGIVVVTINYRLGAFGFLAHPELSAESPGHVSGNYGLLDQIAALKWLRANVAAFGGDPDAITIAGQSAGAASVVDLDVSPLTKGLYARAVVESGPALGLPISDLKRAEQSGAEFAKSRGATSLAELRALPPDRLVTTLAEGLRFLPIVDGVALPGDPRILVKQGRFNDTPILAGLTADELTGFSPKLGSMTTEDCEKAVAMMSGAMTSEFQQAYLASAENCNEGVRRLSRDRGIAATYFWAVDRMVTAKRLVFIYLYDHAEPGPDAARYRAFHSSEIPYVFKTLATSPERPFTELDQQISNTMSAYWINFVKTGNPNGTPRPEWPAFNASRMQIMNLGDTFGPRPVLPSENYQLLQNYLANGGRLGLF